MSKELKMELVKAINELSQDVNLLKVKHNKSQSMSLKFKKAVRRVMQ